MESKIIYCQGCGAALDVQLNREFIFCSYCGAKNIIQSQEMKTNINMSGVNIQAKTDIESILASVEYSMSTKNYKKAQELLGAAIISGARDYRIYILKAKIELLLDTNGPLFESLATLKKLEQENNGKEVFQAVCALMRFRGMNGVIPLHIATFHENIEFTEYCVKHGSDVNCIAGMNRVTPISIMFVPISPNMQKLDGTPFVRNKARVKHIRQYLMANGATDKFRFGY